MSERDLVCIMAAIIRCSDMNYASRHKDYEIKDEDQIAMDAFGVFHAVDNYIRERDKDDANSNTERK